MFFPLLSKLNQQYNVPLAIVDKLDTWLGLLPKFQRAEFQSEFFAREYSLDYSVVDTLFAYAVEIGVLTINYDIYCPACNDKVTTYKSITDIEPIITCDSGHRFNTRGEYISVSYTLQYEPESSLKKKVVLCV